MLVTWMSPAETAEPAKMLFAVQTLMGLRNHLYMGYILVPLDEYD